MLKLNYLIYHLCRNFNRKFRFVYCKLDAIRWRPELSFLIYYREKYRGTWNSIARYDKMNGFLDLILYDSSDNRDFFYFHFDDKMSSFENT